MSLSKWKSQLNECEIIKKCLWSNSLECHQKLVDSLHAIGQTYLASHFVRVYNMCIRRHLLQPKIKRLT